MNKKLKKKIERLEKSFHDIYSQYKEALLEAIKHILANDLHISLGQALNVEEIIQEDYFDTIGKYETPDDSPSNFILFSFGLDNDGKLTVDAFDNAEQDGEWTWTFYEEEFSPEELDQILGLLENVQNALEEGTLVMGKDFRVEKAEDEE